MYSFMSFTNEAVIGLISACASVQLSELRDDPRGFLAEHADGAIIDEAQRAVCGTARLKLYKGLATCVGRWSEKSLYSEAHVTFEDDAGAYDQKDAEGFIKLNALRLKLLAARNKRLS